MTFTGSPDESTPNESQTQQDVTPLSQRGSGQNALFTSPIHAVQAAAQQVANRIAGTTQSQQQVGAGNGAGNGNGGYAGDGNEPLLPITCHLLISCV